jgi:two-component system phosphate regulon response regulator PhoB
MKGQRPILIVDDEDDLRDLLEINLQRERFETVTACTGEEALKMASRHRPCLIVLDLMLPDMSGVEVCRRLRSKSKTENTPIIMLTAKGEEIDRVVGFEVGADDYVVKASFSIREFILRVRALLRRGGGKPSAVNVESVQGAGASSEEVLHIDEAAHRVYVSGDEVKLTVTEFRLLHTLYTSPGRVQTRGGLLQDVWDMPADLNTRTVDTHVKRLREKLGEGSIYIETVRGIGYRFNADAED